MIEKPIPPIRYASSWRAGFGRPSITTAAARSPASSPETAAITNTSPMRIRGHAVARPPALNNSSSTQGRHRGGRDQFRHTIVCDKCFQVTDSRQACLAAGPRAPVQLACARLRGCAGARRRRDRRSAFRCSSGAATLRLYRPLFRAKPPWPPTSSADPGAAPGREGEDDAAFAIDFALAAIDEAEYAVLDATLARQKADALSEQHSGATA